MGRAQHTQIEQPHRAIQRNGWREGRPVEDPSKTKRWGLVTAKPSEFLIHVRRGRVRPSSSGQGATCFKWPWDTVSVIPTSLQRLAFSADQVTKERVGVEVVGLAVYRIVDPMLAYRVLNFSFPERAQQKLEETLTGMFVGATRRLVAKLTVDACLEERKSALADELLREVAPVVGGHGSPDDITAQGWGVVIDTIEIQEVRVLSEKVFADMQAPYRARLEHAAATARADAARAAAVRQAESRRAIEEARIAAERDVKEKEATLTLALAESEQKARLAALERKDEAAKKQALLEEQAAARALESQLRELDRRAEAAKKQALLEEEAAMEAQKARLSALERTREAAEAELATHAIRLEATLADAALNKAAREAELEAKRDAAVALRDAALLAAEGEARRAEIEMTRAEARARVASVESLPEVAKALGQQRIEQMRVTQIGGDAKNPLSSLTEAIVGVMELAKQA